MEGTKCEEGEDKGAVRRGLWDVRMEKGREGVLVLECEGGEVLTGGVVRRARVPCGGSGAFDGVPSRSRGVARARVLSERLDAGQVGHRYVGGELGEAVEPQQPAVHSSLGPW